MTTVYLHVGMPKCASSALQSFLHRNDKLHRSEGLLYPTTCRENSGYFSHRPLHQLEPADVPAAVERIAQEAEDADCNRILLSSEEFVNSLWDRQITGSIIAALNDKFGVGNVRILMLFRNPFPFVESVYAQYLKGGMFRIPDAAFMKSPDNDIVGLVQNFRDQNGFDFFSYSAFIERIRLQAPENPFDLLSTERSDWGGEDVLDVLCRKLGISRGDPAVSANERYSEAALFLLHHSRRAFGFQRTKKRRDIVSKLFPGKTRRFSKLLHVHGALFDRIAESVLRDRDYFRAMTNEPSTGLFSIPQSYLDQRDMDDQLTVPKWWLRLIDQVITSDEMNIGLARELKAEMRRKVVEAREARRDGKPQ
ncbi:hypothetical protein Q4511_03305 [Paracoccus sp. 1_MG-2023]|uniref:hypothetical protein n=1 Tax=unclassified Paracoccus (in: a-proteobacteria) TaxID=2688777 RepID=UPI001C09B729|nr:MULTISPECIES: hypothetical protein [unclassified Paracoccus (in: a-proteobacteria)]MBU2956262.1 hypothetical protein [Paracoccus sp. C2R09]MDO6667939.1 hypothetical protein [Paracoccus sp. 1_MG-2023]